MLEILPFIVAHTHLSQFIALLISQHKIDRNGQYTPKVCLCIGTYKGSTNIVGALRKVGLHAKILFFDKSKNVVLLIVW